MADKESPDDILSQSKTNPSSNKHTVVRRVLSVFLVIILLAVASGGTYYWQHNKLTAANTKINSLNTEAKTLKKNNTSFKTKLAATQSKLDGVQLQNNQAQSALQKYQISASETQDHLNITVESAQYVNPAGTVTAGGSWFGLRVTISNPTSNPINLAVNNLQLEDSNDNLYQIAGFSGATTLPEGWGSNTIQNQTLSPNQSIVGDLIFQLPNTQITNFTLLNGSKSYSVSES